MTKNHFIEPIGQAAGRAIVYVREITPAEMPDELRGQGARLYGVHDADGNRLALTQNRGAAFALAKHNHMVPLSVH
jgi:hypothetical protein